MREETDDTQALVLALINKANLTPKTISEKLDNRVSLRTVYRWKNGESLPGNNKDYKMLVELYKKLCT